MKSKLMYVKKLMHVMMVLVAVCFTLNVFCVPAYADTYDEVEDNDTMEIAQLIRENATTREGILEGIDPNQYLVRGYASSTDEDWFMVRLTAGERYWTCQENTYDYIVMDSDGEILLDGTHYSGTGLKTTRFVVAETGYYYVKITGNSTSNRYKFTIGGPRYTTGYCDIPCEEGTIYMTSGGGSQTVHFNGAALKNLPEGAMADSVKMSNVLSSYVSGILLTNNERGLDIALDTYTWKKDGLVFLNLPVNSEWTAKLGYNRNKSFTPVLRVYYTYPIL